MSRVTSTVPEDIYLAVLPADLTDNPYELPTETCTSGDSDSARYKAICGRLLERLSRPSCIGSDFGWQLPIADTLDHCSVILSKAVSALESDQDVTSARGEWTSSAVSGVIRRSGTNRNCIRKSRVNYTYPQLEFTLSRGPKKIHASAVDRWGHARSFVLLSHAPEVHSGPIYVGRAIPAGHSDRTHLIMFLDPSSSEQTQGEDLLKRY
jgi:hypothetical protein